MLHRIILDPIGHCISPVSFYVMLRSANDPTSVAAPILDFHLNHTELKAHFAARFSLWPSTNT